MILTDRAKAFQQRLRLTAKGRHGAATMNRDEAREALDFILTEEADPAQISAFITAMRFKGTEKQEFLGFLDAVYARSVEIRPEVEDLLNCNGPYDGRKKSALLSPAAALVASAAGVPVILHSSANLPPKYGVTTAQVLEYLGIPVFLDPEDVKKSIEKLNFGFLHAFRYLEVFEKFRPLRQLLHYRSFINTCEVIMNPAGARLLVFGAAHEHFMTKLAEVLVERGAERVFAVSGIDGSDEIPLGEAATVEYRDREYRSSIIKPEMFGLASQPRIKCPGAREIAREILRVFDGEETPYLEPVVYNAAIRIYTGKKAPTIQDGIQMAKEIVSSGRARTHVKKLVGSTLL